MKAILVVDVPVLDDGRHLCDGCPIWNREKCFCEYDRNMGTKGCPLRPMPKKLPEVSYDSWWGWNKIFNRVLEALIKVRDFAKGWNACLDEITGETE
ncbi:MAG: hypothetical protein IKD59_05480 [Lachnospiraceae bacterium]|nr:hypothetical protein [Lachnospiraceae bacterium]